MVTVVSYENQDIFKTALVIKMKQNNHEMS